MKMMEEIYFKFQPNRLWSKNTPIASLESGKICPSTSVMEMT